MVETMNDFIYNHTSTMPDIPQGCGKFDFTHIDEQPALQNTDTKHIITTVKELMVKCLHCKYFPEKCHSQEALVDYLQPNGK